MGSHQWARVWSTCAIVFVLGLWLLDLEDLGYPSLKTQQATQQAAATSRYEAAQAAYRECLSTQHWTYRKCVEPRSRGRSAPAEPIRERAQDRLVWYLIGTVIVVAGLSIYQGRS